MGLRGAGWCSFSARAIATVIRSCRNMERSRRSLRRWAALVELPARVHHAGDTNKREGTLGTDSLVVVVCCLLLFVVALLLRLFVLVLCWCVGVLVCSRCCLVNNYC